MWRKRAEPVVDFGERRAARGIAGLGALVRSGGSGSRAGHPAVVGGLDQRADRRGVLRGHGQLRHWRWIFGRKGVAGRRARTAPGRAASKAQAALSVIEQVLAPEIVERPNWTLPRLQEEIERRTGERLSKSRLSVVLKKGVCLATIPAHAEGTSGCRCG